MSKTFISDDGSLYRLSNGDVIRADYSYHWRMIKSCAQFKACLRAGKHTSLGGYPLYFICSDGAALSFESARENLRQILWSIQNKANDGWRVVACDVNYEDNELTCDHSGKLIPAAYDKE